MSDDMDNTLPEQDVEMTFFEHLAELRKRLIRAVLGVFPAMLIAWGYKELLLDLLTQPLIRAWHNLNLGDPQLHFANPVDPFLAYLMLAAIGGVILASPWIFWQLWAFIAPGLYSREKRFAIPFVLVSTVCFVGGVAFGYTIVFELAFETLLAFAGFLPGEGLRISPTLMLTEYLRFSTRMLLAFGITFEVPVVTTFLSIAGVVSWRQLASFSRWWLLVSALVAALLTPPDVGSQMLMLIPLNVLYWVGIVFAALLGPRQPKSGERTKDGYER